MALYSVLAARKKAIVKLARTLVPGIPPAAQSYPAEKFTDGDWHLEQRCREAADVLDAIRHWNVTVTPSDGLPRRYYLHGLLPNVLHRAHQFFPNDSHVVLAEPALARLEMETIDRRVNLSNKPLPTELPT